MEFENNFSKPVVVLSACLDSEPVRYNGEILHIEPVQKLKNFVEFVKVCPEVSINLGVPRDPIKIYLDRDDYRLFQTKTGIDLTERMKEFSNRFLDTCQEVDGFLLKGKSPSCGASGTKIYRDKNAKDIVKRGTGLFAMIVKKRFPDTIVEDELRLKNHQIKRHFLTRIFASSEMRNLEKNIKTIKELIDFHTRYKYLLMLYNQKKLTQLGKIVAGYKKGNLESTVSEYSKIFYTSFEKRPGIKKQINVIQHIYGYFSGRLNSAEKKHFLSLLKKYRDEKIPFETVFEMMKGFVFRFEIEYLLNQRYFIPYPQDLNE